MEAAPVEKVSFSKSLCTRSSRKAVQDHVEEELDMLRDLRQVLVSRVEADRDYAARLQAICKTAEVRGRAGQ